jgi:FkbM family methyltransferase
MKMDVLRACGATSRRRRIGLLTALTRFLAATRSHDLARSHQAVALARFATLQVRTRLHGRPLLVPFVGGTRIFVGAGYRGANGNYYWGLHEFADMAFVLHYLRPNDLFVDVGANVGSYTLLASGVVGARTIAFEPAPQSLARLRANRDANRLSARVDIREVCIGANTGVVTFSTDADTMNSIVRCDDLPNTIRVPLRQLDAEIAEPPVLIKIDTEGSDDDVLAGSKELLRGSRPLALLIETLGGGAFGGEKTQTANRLAQLGFVRCSYDPRVRSVRHTSAPPENNYLFIRDMEFARMRIASAQRFDLNGFGTV